MYGDILSHMRVLNAGKLRPSGAGRNQHPSCAIEALEPRLLLTTYSVDSLADVVADDGYVTLREALEAADTNTAVYDAPEGSTGEDTIQFSLSGVIELNGYALVIGREGDKGDLTITGGVYDVTLDAEGVSRVFDIDTGDEVSISYLTMTNGFEEHGGGVHVDGGGTLVLANCTISDNTAYYSGGGIWSVDTDLTLTDTIVDGNEGEGALGGGGIDFDGFANDRTLALTDCTISDNTSAGHGGGIWIRSGVSVSTQIIGTIVSGNTAVGHGGGIYTDPTSGPLTLNNTDVLDNIADGSGGGIWSTGSLTLTNDTKVSGNIASGNGGGIWGNSTVELTDTTVADNYANGDGDAIYANGDVTLSDDESTTSTFTVDVIGSSTDSFITTGNAGNVVLGAWATLEIKPKGGNEFDVGTYTLISANGDLTGTFASVTYLDAYVSVGTNEDGLVYDITNDTLKLTLDLNLNPADANFDGMTDVSDRIIWNNNNFTYNTKWVTADWNDDELTDASDRIVWNNNNFTFATDGEGQPTPDYVATISAWETLAYEEDQDTATFHITLDNEVAEGDSVDVYYMLYAGPGLSTADSSDYETLDGYVTIGEYETTADIVIRPEDDSKVESTEVLMLALETDPLWPEDLDYGIGSSYYAMVFIFDND